MRYLHAFAHIHPTYILYIHSFIHTYIHTYIQAKEYPSRISIKYLDDQDVKLFLPKNDSASPNKSSILTKFVCIYVCMYVCIIVFTV